MFHEVRYEEKDFSIAVLESYYIIQVNDAKLLQSLVANSTIEFPIPGWIKRIRPSRKDKPHQLLVTKETGEEGLFNRIQNFYSVDAEDISIIELPSNPPISRKVFNEWKSLYWPLSFRKITEEPVIDLDLLASLSSLPPFSECTESTSIIASPDGEIILSASSYTDTHPLKHDIMVCIDKIALIRSEGEISVDNYLCKGLDLWTWREVCIL
jgi:hypothetical protein